MKLLTGSLLFISAPVLLSGCGGGSSSSPYDGTWQAVYPSLSIASSYTETKEVDCNTPPATLRIENTSGTTVQTTTCVTRLYSASIAPTATTAAVPRALLSTSPASNTQAYIGVRIEPKATGSGNYDVLHAVVNGVSFTGECITTSSCSAASPTGITLGLTR